MAIAADAGDAGVPAARSSGAGSTGGPPPWTVADVIAAWSDGTAPEFTFFWRETSIPDGRVGTGCLSQWFPCRCEVDGVVYRSAEHWTMAQKARLFGDAEALRWVMSADHPAEAKKAGRAVRGYDERTWRRHRYDIVVAGNFAKFGGSPALRGFLLGTAPSVLAEASPHDLVWGIGLESDDARARNPTLWRGQNLLGFALMEVRHRLQS